MFQDIQPHVYSNEFSDPEKDGYALYFSGNSVCTCVTDDDSVVLPTTAQFPGADTADKIFLFTIDEVPYYWITSDLSPNPAAFRFTSLDTIRGRRPKPSWYYLSSDELDIPRIKWRRGSVGVHHKRKKGTPSDDWIVGWCSIITMGSGTP